MKKTVICFLLLIVFLSFTSASQDWKIENYLDDFGDVTGEVYITTGTESGTFSGYSTSELQFNWQIRIDEYDTTFILLDTAPDYVKGGFSDSDITITVRDDNGDDYFYDAYNSGKYIEIMVSDNLSLFRILATNKTPRIIIKVTDSNYNYSIYKLGALDTTGLATLYKDTFGLDWSLPLSIELLPDTLELATDYTDIPSIEVNISLGGEEIECWNTRTFAYSLTKEIQEDTGFFEMASYIDPVTSDVDSSHIYLYNFSANKEERYGYITVQIGEVVAQCLVSVVEKPNETEDVLTPGNTGRKQGTISENSDDEVKLTDTSEEVEDFSLNEFYRGGELLVKATLTSTSGEVVFNADEDEVKSILLCLNAVTRKFDNISYKLIGSLLELTYPATSEETVESYWQDFKYILNAYNEARNQEVEIDDNELVVSKSADTVRGTLSASIYSGRAEITIPEGMSNEEFLDFIATLIEVFPEFKGYGTFVCQDSTFILYYSDLFSNRLASDLFESFIYWLNNWLEPEEIVEIEENTSEQIETAKYVKSSPNTLISLRGRVEYRASSNYKGKNIEGTCGGVTKTGESDTHGLAGTILEARYFVSDNLFLSLSGGLSFYSYSFKEQVKIRYKKTTNTYSHIVLGALAEFGIGLEKDKIYGDIRFGVVKTFKPEYNENTNLTLAAVFGFYYAEVGLGLDYNIAENKLRFQGMIALSVPLCHLSNENGQKEWKGF